MTKIGKQKSIQATFNEFPNEKEMIKNVFFGAREICFHLDCCSIFSLITVKGMLPHKQSKKNDFRYYNDLTVIKALLPESVIVHYTSDVLFLEFKMVPQINVFL